MAMPLAGLPDAVLELMRSAIVSEFATVSAKGVPIDTPTFCFIGPDGLSLDIATGLAYPAKAERARKNPKVGLLLEGLPHEPVVSVAGVAAVKDADLQANADRYIAETIAYLDSYAAGNPWSVARKAVWYWTRIIVCVRPKRILWWPSAEAMDAAPARWDAPANFVFPASDPIPPGAPSAAPSWPLHDWRPRAEEILGLGIPGHLTLLDDDGFPLPIRARRVSLVDDGFALDVPAGAPWSLDGAGSLCFAGIATFIGAVRAGPSGTRFIVERTLPVLPTMQDPNEIWSPSPATYDGLMGRLKTEVARRGQPIPTIAEAAPAPTQGGLARASRMARIGEEMAMRDGGGS